ncbi:hypothetical protein FNV43_RR27231 [Rhamnella rubrinervis]|uniref:tRNA(adenine(34)) deaminase n=1 Tax=Rhamnella rubrinervis TaxID=2594499 RepID=A0A8K0GPH7_9ROSA|nr:hypothetical protein FNV43_RR27231 [Rhamnella rubrinervis]
MDMLNSYVSSAVYSLRSNGNLPFPVSDYSCFLNERFDGNPSQTISSCCTCCVCCALPTHRLSITAGYLYGLRQSSLLQWSASRKLILGVDRYYRRIPVYGIGRGCYEVPCFLKERSIYKTSGVRRKESCCKVHKGNNEIYDSSHLDEAEALLNLLTEEVSEEYVGESRNGTSYKRLAVESRGSSGRREGNVSSSERVQLEKRGNCSSKCNSGKKNTDEVRLFESNLKHDFESEGKLSSSERVQVQKRGNYSGKCNSGKKNTDGLTSFESNLKNEIESVNIQSREEKSRRNEEREALLRGDNCRGRKVGSSCSSYYSFSSVPDFDSETEVHDKYEQLEDESLTGYKDSVLKGEGRYDGRILEKHKVLGDGEEKHIKVLEQRNTAVGDVVQQDWRNKSEKKLTDTLGEERQSSMESSQMHTRVLRTGESSYTKASSSYKQFSNEENSKLAVNLKKGARKQYADKGIQVDRVSTSSGKIPEYKEMPVIHGDDDETTSQTPERLSSRIENLEIGVNLIGQEKEDQCNTVNRLTEKDKFSGNGRHHRRKSEEDLDTKRTFVSQRQSETGMIGWEEDTKTSFNSVQETEEQYYHTGQDIIGQANSRRKHQQSTEILEICKSNIEKTSNIQSETSIMPPSSQLIARGSSQVESTSGLASEVVSKKTSERGTALSVNSKGEPLVLQHESNSRNVKGECQGEPLNIITPEDALGSADRIQKSSMQFVGEFVEKMRHEVSCSEVQIVENVSETKLTSDDDNFREKSSSQYGSEDFHLKEHHKARSSGGSGAKGPSDEMWDVTDPSIPRTPMEEEAEATVTAGNAIVGRSSRSLWNVISDLVRLRWGSRSDTPSSTARSGGKISSNDSGGGEEWSSVREPEENKDKHMKDRGPQSETTSDQMQHKQIILQGQGEESVIMRPSDKIRYLEADMSPSRNIVESGSTSGVSIPSCEGTIGGNEYGKSFQGSSGTEMVGSSLPSAARTASSTTVSEISRTNNKNASGSGLSGQMEQPAGANLNEGLGNEGKDGELKKRKLQRNKQVPKDRFDEWEEAYKFETEQRKIDEMFMREALLEARKAADTWEVPVGAVLVQHGKIIARGCNLVEELRDSTAHAEIICIREASKLLRTWRLSETTLYVTLEPCAMCAGAILQARVDTLVWGAPNKLLGADGSWIRLFPDGGGENSSEPSDKPAAPIHPFHPKISIRRDILASECADVMQQFFQLRRRKKERQAEPAPPSSLHKPAASMHSFDPKMNIRCGIWASKCARLQCINSFS